MQCPAKGARGKLIAVASRWASGRGFGKPAEDAATEAAAQARAEIAARRAGRMPVAEAEIEVGPDEYDAVRLFLSLGTQWRVHAMSAARLGLEYSAIAGVAAMMGIAMTPSLFEDLRTMERAALAAFPRS